MISFIVIGKNEGWKLTKCFESIFKTIEYNQLKEYEVIYVDSKSTDDSIARAKKFPKIKIFQITGECNAAIGRNIGAKESTGEVLFFIDGDMEIIPEFLPLVYSAEIGLVYPFVSGQFINFNYNDKWELLSKKKQYSNLNKKKYFSSVGGIFLIKKELWVRVNGMRINFERSQDTDLGLRISQKGIKLMRKIETIAIHNTIPYDNESRMWQLLFSSAHYYGRGFLYRKNFFNINLFPYFIRNDYTAIFLFVLILLLLVNINFITLFSIYLILIFAKSIKKKKIIIFFPFYILRDFITIFSFFLFYPQKYKKIEYKELK